MTTEMKDTGRRNEPRSGDVRLLFAACLLLVTVAPALAEGDPVRGKTVFNRCGSCHSVTGQTRIGPSLDGVAGRIAGAVAGARYSNALKNSGLVWTDENLDRYLAAPRTVVPGTSMTIGLPRPQDRADLIAFLKTLGPSGGP